MYIWMDLILVLLPQSILKQCYEVQFDGVLAEVIVFPENI